MATCPTCGQPIPEPPPDPDTSPSVVESLVLDRSSWTWP